MYQKSIIFQGRDGLHVRLAAMIVKKAKEFESDIVITKSGTKESAKSLFKLQSLEISKGDNIIVSAQGQDEEQAGESIVELINILGKMEQ
eukprot:gene12220-14310_t